MAVPAAKVFFEEVRAAFDSVAARLGLEGPVETERVLPVATYTRGVLEYETYLDQREASLEIHVGVRTKPTLFTAGVEPLAIAAGIVERRGGVSFSAHNLKQMKKSLAGQLRYVELLHPLLAGDTDSAVELMRKADAREW
ncbi:hypothetical protein ACIBU0_21720 [Streptomyces sp. NPDC049627]|uniref:hypothetical protein n=1 Tax=Streptomyces sp. NPDC049627 TaxID=3365595 RepID=UPI00378F60EE